MTMPWYVTITMVFNNPSLSNDSAIAQVAAVDLSHDLDAIGLSSDLEYITDVTTAPTLYTVQREIYTYPVTDGLVSLVPTAGRVSLIKDALRDTIPQRACCQLVSIDAVIATPPT